MRANDLPVGCAVALMLFVIGRAQRISRKIAAAIKRASTRRTIACSATPGRRSTGRTKGRRVRTARVQRSLL